MAADSLAGAAGTGDRRKTLVALRDRLAEQLETCKSAHGTAALTGQFLAVLEQIEALPKPVEGTPLDELAQRRTSGERVAARPARARRG